MSPCARQEEAPSSPQLKIERHSARDALEPRAGNSRSREVPFVDNYAVPDCAKIIVRVGVVGLPRVDEVR